MTLKVINHRRSKIKSKGTRKNSNKSKKHSTPRYRRRHSVHVCSANSGNSGVNGGGRSKGKSRSPSPARSRSRSPLPDSYPEDIKQFVGNVTYGYKIFSDDDGNYTGVELINLRTLSVVGDLKDAHLHNHDYMESLENGVRRFRRNDWDIDHDLDQQQLNNVH